MVGIGFTDAMLSWPAGPKPEDGIWAEHWYANTHRSTGFGEYVRPEVPDEIRDHPILPECEAMYDRLAAHLITL